MQKAVGIVFLISWLLCGCSIDAFFDDWHNAFVVVIALIVCILSAIVLANWDK